MKKALIFSLIGIALATVSFTDPINTITGRWQRKNASGRILMANFRSDGSYDGFINGKPFVSGKYYVRQDTFAISDASCNINYYGTYRLHFLSADSVRFAVIQDTCGGRREGTDKLALGRIKPTKP